MLRKPILHPFLFALYSVLFLFANNIDRLRLEETYRLTLILLLGTAACLGFLRLLSRSWQRAGLVTSLAVVLFASYGHAYNALAGRSALGRADVIAAAWAAGFILLGWWFLRKLPDPQPWNQTLNLVALFLVLLPLGQIGVYAVRQAGSPSLLSERLTNVPALHPPASQRPPDIYYLILDEYGREDVLQQVLDFDNGDFITGLRERGFYVADESRANYAITHLSISSSLNFTYLDPASTGMEIRDLYPVVEMIRNNRARAMLAQAGYTYVTFATGYSFTETRDADVYIRPPGYINDFELEYLLSSGAAVGSDFIQGLRERGLILNAFDRLETLPEYRPEAPKFVFAHIQAAHAPYVFGADGGFIQPWGFSSWTGAEGDGRDYAQVYRDQVSYVNRLILKTVDAILASSPTEPIIILQGDHGSQALLNWFSVDQPCLKERMSIFNAYYLPGDGARALYPSITPVNTFRLIFDTYFGTDLGRLPDRAYFSRWDQSYDFIDVTDRLDACQTPAR